MRDSCLVTYNGGNHSQIDVILTRRWNRATCNDYKVILEKWGSPNIGLAVLNVYSRVKKKMTSKLPYIRWWALKTSNLLEFKENVWEKGYWDLEGDVDIMWKRNVRVHKRSCNGSARRV